MATFYPPLKEIEKMRNPPTEGEWRLLTFLDEYLAGQDDYEIFFQSHLEGYRPDVFILREGHGALIIEVKDYNMELYDIDDCGNWAVNINASWQPIKSPVDQVEGYKRVIYGMFSCILAEKAAVNSKQYGLIACAVFLSNADRYQINKVRWKHKTFIQHRSNCIFGKYDLNQDFFDIYFRAAYLSVKSWYFTYDVYDELKWSFKPTDLMQHEGSEYNITLSEKQNSLAQSSKSNRAKIRGVAGSGKTSVLAKLAYNASLRCDKPVLILTFNITLRNYIRDKISALLPADMPHRGRYIREHFIILHYHQFMFMYRSEHLIKNKRDNAIEEYKDENFIFSDEDNVKYKFDTILVDEAQDYKREWIDSIHKVLSPSGEIVFFADEKQGIYKRALSYEGGEKRKRVYTKLGSSVRWKELPNNTFRMASIISDLANKFQQEFLSQSYEYEPMKAVQQSLFEEIPIIKYYFMRSFATEKIISLFNDFRRDNSPHKNDICFLGNRINELRKLDYSFRGIGFSTTCTFESEETYTSLLRRYSTEDEKEILNKALENVRRAKKFAFHRESGKLKFSTIHSFKGWELHTVFLIICNSDSINDEVIYSVDNNSESIAQPNQHELIYTGITRAKKNLIIININDEEYDRFFKHVC